MNDRFPHAIVSGSMIIPTGGTIHETGRVETFDQIRETELGIAFNHLTPAFVVYYLKNLLVTIVA
jgi:hypothetical protein